MMPGALKPCPKCGAHWPIQRNYTCQRYDGTPGGYAWISCSAKEGCNFETAPHRKLEDAILEWGGVFSDSEDAT